MPSVVLPISLTRKWLPAANSGMKRRLLGLETEYAFRCTTTDGRRPDHRSLYEAFLRVVRRRTLAVEGASSLKWKQVFTENGGAFCYESLPYRPDAGLLEAATPECDLPETAALYQLAQDRLIGGTVGEIQADMQGEFPGLSLGILKNCRDAFGHIYGAQENYEAQFLGPVGTVLFPWFVRLFLPAFFLYLIQIVCISLVVAVVHALLLVLGLFASAMLRPILRPLRLELPDSGKWIRLFERQAGWVLTAIEVGFSFPLIFPYLVAIRLAGFRSQRRALTAFLVSRIVLTGSGSVESAETPSRMPGGTRGEVPGETRAAMPARMPDGVFHLSEKASAMRRMMRITNLPADRSIFDTGNLLKQAYYAALGLLRFDTTAYRQLISPVQRMQIGLSDSCMASIPLYLKTALMTLLLDMVDAGALEDAPRLRHPLKALHAFNADPTLTATALDRNGRTWTALSLQRWYLDRARAFFQKGEAADLEVAKALRLWQDLLDDLERDPLLCFGRLDWPTKLELIRRVLNPHGTAPEASTEEPSSPRPASEAGGGFALAKMVDIAYHELPDGYFARLRREGLVVDLFADADINAAMTDPPETLRGGAALRSEIIRDSSFFGQEISMSWNQVRTGQGARSRVVSLADFRQHRRERGATTREKSPDLPSQGP